jgi:transposase-like protein
MTKHKILNIFCPRCLEDDHIVKSGFAPRIGGKKQRYMCMDCGHAFIPKEKV